ncbi:hypothetical protein [Streptomyces sp. NPDC055134]
MGIDVELHSARPTRNWRKSRATLLQSSYGHGDALADFGGRMADYDTHANKAREMLEGMNAKSLSRSYELTIAAAQVEAILALAAAITDQRAGRDIR